MMEKEVIRVVDKALLKLVKELTSVNPYISYRELNLDVDNKSIIEIFIKDKHALDLANTLICTVEARAEYSKVTYKMHITIDVLALHDHKLFTITEDHELTDLYTTIPIFGKHIHYLNSNSVRIMMKNKANLIGSYINYSIYYVNKQIGIHLPSVGLHRSSRTKRTYKRS